MSDLAAYRIHKPGSDHPSLADTADGFDRNWFMGKWAVAWSTLPMWEDKRDVVINYEPVATGSKINTTFNSVVEYHKKSAAQGSKPSTVKGSETLSTGANGATFDWRGASYLFFVTSHWEALGYGIDKERGLEWAVTFFSKTLFTPAGIDIYIRRLSSSSSTAASDGTVRDDLVRHVVEAIRACEDEGVVKLAQGGFTIPGVM